jgi:CheY-like chemotaxis protein
VTAAMRRPANATLVAVGTAGLLSGVGIAWIVAHGGPDRPGVPNLPLAVPVAVPVGWSFIGSGLLYWRSRPDNYLGPVLIFQGFAWFVSLLVAVHNPVLFTLGEALYGLQYVSGLYLVLSFPSGRLQGRLDRWLMIITIVVATVVNWSWLLFADPHQMLCRNCPANLLEVTRDDTAVIGINYVIRVAGIAIALAAIGLLLRRWIRASHAQRHAVLPVAVAGAVAFGAIMVAYVVRVAGMSSPNGFDWFAYYASAAIPVAVLAVIVQRRLSHGAVAGLVVELGGPGPAGGPGGSARRPAQRGQPAGPGDDTAGGVPVRVVVADDAVLLREGLARLLGEAGFEVAGLAGDAAGLLELVQRTGPDVAIVDIRMPPTHTDEGCGRVTLGHPGALRGVLSAGFYLAVMAWVGLGLGTVIRHTAGAITAMIGVVFLLPHIIQALPAPWDVRIGKYGLDIAAQQVIAQHPTAGYLPAGTSFLICAGYAVAAIAAAALLVTRRDA